MSKHRHTPKTEDVPKGMITEGKKSVLPDVWNLKLPAYDPAKFWKIDWRALPADLAFILFGIVLSHDYFSYHYFFTEISPKKLLALYLVVVVTICWYMGFVFARYNVYYNTTINKLARWILTIAGLTLLGYLLAIILPIFDEQAVQDASVEHFGMFAIFMLVLGPLFGLGGYLTARRAIQFEATGKLQEKDFGDGESLYVILIFLFVAVAALVYGTQTDFVQHSSVQGLWIALVFIGAVIVGAIAIGILMGIKKLLVKIGLYYRLAFIFETVFPFIIISSLIFWNEMQRHYLSGLSPAGYLGVLFFTGILPFRILLIFNPPLRIFNLIIGTGSFLFFMWSLLQ